MADLPPINQEYDHERVITLSPLRLVATANHCPFCRLTRRHRGRLYFSILTRLYRYTGNTTHLDYAMNTLNWWLEWAFDVDSGRVYDTVEAQWVGQYPSSECARSGLESWTYNSGAFLFGLADLYYATGNTRVLDLGRSIAYAAIRDFVPDPSTGIVVESCENDPPPGKDLPPGCQQDETVVRLTFSRTLRTTAPPETNFRLFSSGSSKAS